MIGCASKGHEVKIEAETLKRIVSSLSHSSWREGMEDKAIGTKEIIQRIKHILVEEMQLNVVCEEIPDDYSLLESGLALDSILIAELVARIEDRFALQLDDRVLKAELFNNLSLLAGFVAQEYLTARERLAARCNVRDSQSEEAAC
jgi:acyl carrier protein